MKMPDELNKNIPQAPCQNCTDRFPACHDSAKCDKWAEYENKKQAIAEARAKDYEMQGYDCVVRYRPRAKRKFNAIVKGDIK